MATMTAGEARVLNVFANVVYNFLNNKKVDNHAEMVEELLLNLQELRSKMSIKMQRLHSYLSKFPENLGNVRNKASVSIRTSK